MENEAVARIGGLEGSPEQVPRNGITRCWLVACVLSVVSSLAPAAPPADDPDAALIWSVPERPSRVGPPLRSAPEDEAPARPAVSENTGQAREVLATAQPAGTPVDVSVVESQGETETKVPSPVVQDEPVVEPPPEPSELEKFLTGWERRIELGLAGSEGNSTASSFRGKFRAERKTDLNETRLNLEYVYATRDSRVTANRFASEIRYDKLMKDSSWRYFARASYDADQFQSWDHRVTLGGGFGYQVLKTDKTNLLARGGLSLAQDIGGPNDDIRAEGILGFDLSHKLNDRQRLTANLDVLPGITEQRLRVNAKAEWEIMIDPERKLSLKVGGQDRYDSDAGGGAKRNDLSYYMLLAIQF